MKSSLRSRLTAFAVIAATATAPLTAHAWDMPAPVEGTFSVAFFEHTWGRGAHYAQLDRGANPMSTLSAHPDLRRADWDGPGDPNNAMSSYQLCNNAGRPRTFRVRLYRDASYIALISDETFTLQQGECTTRNIIEQDVLTSFMINY